MHSHLSDITAVPAEFSERAGCDDNPVGTGTGQNNQQQRNGGVPT